MEYAPDLVKHWPAFADESFTGAAALFVADRDMDGDAFRVISDGIVSGGRYFALFLSTESDTALHRKLTYWKRHPDIAALGATWERSYTDDGKICRVALLELSGFSQMRDALWSVAFPSRAVRARRLLVRFEDGVDADAVAAALTTELRRRGRSPGDWEMRWLLRGALGFGVLVIRAEESIGGQMSGLGFYGQSGQVDEIWNALSEDNPT